MGYETGRFQGEVLTQAQLLLLFIFISILQVDEELICPICSAVLEVHLQMVYLPDHVYFGL